MHAMSRMKRCEPFMVVHYETVKPMHRELKMVKFMRIQKTMMVVKWEAVVVMDFWKTLACN